MTALDPYETTKQIQLGNAASRLGDQQPEPDNTMSSRKAAGTLSLLITAISLAVLLWVGEDTEGALRIMMASQAGLAAGVIVFLRSLWR